MILRVLHSAAVSQCVTSLICRNADTLGNSFRRRCTSCPSTIPQEASCQKKYSAQPLPYCRTTGLGKLHFGVWVGKPQFWHPIPGSRPGQSPQPNSSAWQPASPSAPSLPPAAAHIKSRAYLGGVLPGSAPIFSLPLQQNTNTETQPFALEIFHVFDMF